MEEDLDVRHDQAVESLRDGEALMMWLVNKKKLQAGIERGVQYFESKYGLRPNIIIANPTDVVLEDGTILDEINDMMVATSALCLPSHTLIGIVSSIDSVWKVSL